MIFFTRRFHTRGVMAIAVDSLLKHRLRSLLSVVGIICGVAAVFAILSIGEGAKREVLEGISQLGLDNIIIHSTPLSQGDASGRAQSTGLSLRDVAFLEKIPVPIETVAYLKEVQAGISGVSKEIMPPFVACSSNYLQVLGLTPAAGRFFLPRDEEQQRLVCVLGSTLAQRLGSLGRVGARLKIDDQIFLVIGIVQGNPPQSGKTGRAVVARDLNAILFLPFGTHLFLNVPKVTTGSNTLDEIILKFFHRVQVEGVLPLIRRTLDLRRHNLIDYQLVVPRQLLRQAQKTQRIFNIVLGAIGGISLIVGGIGIMNVLLATVAERTREIGIRRAVGASREDIIVQFLAESVVLTSVGGVLGLGAGVACSWLIARFAGWNVAVTVYGVLLPLITSVVVGILFGLYPAMKASDLDPVQALRAM